MPSKMDMPAEIIVKARADLARAETAERRALEALETATVEKVRIQHFLELCERYAADNGKPEPRSNAASQSNTLVDAAIDVITERGPTNIGDLLDALCARGLTVGGEKPRSNLAGFLSRGSAKGANIEFREGVGWCLKGTPDTVAATKAIPVVQSAKPSTDMSWDEPSQATIRPAPKAHAGGPSWDAPKGANLDDEIPF